MTKKDMKNQAPLFHKSILLIDDDPLLLKLSRRRLEPLGFKVKSFSNGKDAYDHFEKNFHEYDLVITDQNMPGYLGSELVEKIHAIKPEQPVIIFTGLSDIASSKEGRSTNLIQYVFKPLQKDELIDAVRDMLALGN